MKILFKYYVDLNVSILGGLCWICQDGFDFNVGLLRGCGEFYGCCAVVQRWGGVFFFSTVIRKIIFQNLIFFKVLFYSEKYFLECTIWFLKNIFPNMCREKVFQKSNLHFKKCFSKISFELKKRFSKLLFAFSKFILENIFQKIFLHSKYSFRKTFFRNQFYKPNFGILDIWWVDAGSRWGSSGSNLSS